MRLAYACVFLMLARSIYMMLHAGWLYYGTEVFWRFAFDPLPAVAVFVGILLLLRYQKIAALSVLLLLAFVLAVDLFRYGFDHLSFSHDSAEFVGLLSLIAAIGIGWHLLKQRRLVDADTGDKHDP